MASSYLWGMLAPTGMACGIVLYAHTGFPSCYDYHLHLVVKAIPLKLKLLEFLRCDAPVSLTLALSIFNKQFTYMYIIICLLIT